MKYNDLIKLDRFKEAQITIFNSDRNWHFVTNKNIYIIDRKLDDLFYNFVKGGGASWSYITRRLRFYYINEPKVKPVARYDEYEINDEIDDIYFDGEKL